MAKINRGLQKMMKLSAFASGMGYHSGGWRHPDAYPDATFNFERWVTIAQKLEDAKFDMIFLADSASPTFYDRPEVFARAPFGDRFEPMTLLGGLSAVTKNLGLAATVATSYSQPYDVARQVASLDLMSRGRAAWNIVTGVDSADAQQYAGSEFLQREDRYARGEEFVDVVTALWGSVEPDAYPRDKESGIYAYPEKVHAIDFKGKFYAVKGPLSISPSPQGRPILVQAGQSDAGRALAARVADVVFTAWSSFDLAKQYYDDVKSRAVALNRNPEEVKVLPGVRIIVGRSMEEAQEKEEYLNSLIDMRAAMERLNMGISDGTRGIDLSGYDLDAPFPELPPGVQSGRSVNHIEMARREKLTLRQVLIRSSNSNLHFTVTGTPVQVADQLEYWFHNGAADGFNVLIGYMPGSLDDIIDLVLPELRRRGLFRSEYEGSTLRENLGLSNG